MTFDESIYLLDDDDDDNNEDLIVYGNDDEYTVRPTQQCTQQSLESLVPNQSSDKQNVDQHWMPRHERRKRRLEWRQQELEEPGTSTSSEDDDDASDEDEDDQLKDPFASLQALLQEKSPCSQSTGNDESQPVLVDAKRSPGVTPRGPEIEPEGARQDITPDKTSTPKPAVRMPSSKTRLGETIEVTSMLCDRQIDPSQSAFAAIYYQDYGDSGKETPFPEETNERKHAERRAQKEKRRQLREAKRSWSNPPPTPHFQTPQSPSPQRQKKRRHSSSFTMHAARTKKPSVTSSPMPKQITHNEKTIVGMRPTHWQRPATKRGNTTGTWRPVSQLQSPTRRKLLRAAALQPSISTAGKAMSSERASKLYRPRDLAAMVRKENVVNNKPNAAPTNEAKQPTVTAGKLRPINFRPLSMPKASPFPSPPEENTPSIDDGPNHTSAAIDRPSFSSPPPTRRHRSNPPSSIHKSGFWTKRLAALKSNQTNDAMKLQHPGMNRYGMSFDLNDPRKKAQTYTDVTLLNYTEDPKDTTQWNHAAMSGPSSGSEGPLMTLPCYIHQHQLKSGATVTGIKPVSNVLAWITVTQTTARNIGLRKDMKLRLYDAVILPIRGKQNTVTDDLNARFLLICTQLCEKHPGPLDQVPMFVIKAFESSYKD